MEPNKSAIACACSRNVTASDSQCGDGDAPPLFTNNTPSQARSTKSVMVMVQHFAILALTLLLASPSHGQNSRFFFEADQDTKSEPAKPSESQPPQAQTSGNIYLKCELLPDSCGMWAIRQGKTVSCPE